MRVFLVRLLPGRSLSVLIEIWRARGESLAVIKEMVIWQSVVGGEVLWTSFAERQPVGGCCAKRWLLIIRINAPGSLTCRTKNCDDTDCLTKRRRETCEGLWKASSNNNFGKQRMVINKTGANRLNRKRGYLHATNPFEWDTWTMDQRILINSTFVRILHLFCCTSIHLFIHGHCDLLLKLKVFQTFMGICKSFQVCGVDWQEM